MKRRTAGWLLAVCLALSMAGGPSRAQETTDQTTTGTAVAPSLDSNAVVIRVSVKPDSDGMIGQHLRLLVDVLFPDAMPHPPQVAAPEISGAQVFRFETQATTMNEQIDGKGYVGQRFEFAVYARRAGSLAIPPLTVTLLDANGNPTGTLQSQPLSIEVSAPAGVDASIPVIASSEVEISQEWSQDPAGTFKTGDALKRKIMRTAADVPALAMRDFDFTAPDGLRVYADKPLADDQIDRGDVTGQRVDSVTYLFEKPGTYTLPALSQPWIDSDDHSLQSAVLGEQKLKVEMGPAGAGSMSNAGPLSALTSRTAWPTLLVAMLVLLSLAALAWRFGPRLIAGWRQQQEARRNSEAAAFHSLQKACAGSNAGAIYQAFHSWRSRLPVSLANDRELVASVAPLDQALFGGVAAKIWRAADATALAAAVRSFRERHHETRVAASAPALPPLNPGSLS